MFLVFTLPSWCQMFWWTYRFTLTHNTELYYQFIREIINTSKLTISEAVFRWNVWKRLSAAIHSPMRMMEQRNRIRLYYQFIRKIINTSKLTIFEAIFRWNVWKRLSAAIHNPMRMMEQRNRLRYFGSVFDPLPAVNCFSVVIKPRSVAAEATDDFLHFCFFLIKNTV